jgi:hypothetical protein
MNRKNLTAAVLAGLAGAIGIVGSAQAVNINPDGLGQVLLYPYYTTNGNNITALSVVNTTDKAKAVKVRFLEGQNSREVLDFNLYMSAWDVWTAALYDDDGTPTLVTRDSSCTVPYIYGNGGVQEFLPWALTDSVYLDLDWDEVDVGEREDSLPLKKSPGVPLAAMAGFAVAAVIILLMLVGFFLNVLGLF